MYDARGIGADRERKQPRFVADIVEALAHEALDGIDRARRLGREPSLRFAAYVDGAVGRSRDHRRHEAVADPIANDDRDAVLDVGDEAIGRSEIDPYDFAHDHRMFNAEARRLQQYSYRADSAAAACHVLNSRSMPARRLLM